MSTTDGQCTNVDSITRQTSVLSAVGSWKWELAAQSAEELRMETPFSTRILESVEPENKSKL